MEAELADPSVFSDPVAGKKLMARYETEKAGLEKAAAWWEQVAEEMMERDLAI